MFYNFLYLKKEIMLRRGRSQEIEKLDTYAGNVVGCFLSKNPAFPKGRGDLGKSL